MEQFSVNQTQPVVNEEVVNGPRIQLGELDTYRKCVTDLRTELQTLISENFMTESVAQRITDEFMYTAFGNIVKINLR